MTTTAAVDYAAPEAGTGSASTYTGPRCQACGAPTWRWRGSVWQYTCSTCLDAYLDEGAAKAAERDRRDRQKMARKRIEGNNNDFSPVSGRASGW